jgi:hypothetical protein
MIVETAIEYYCPLSCPIVVGGTSDRGGGTGPTNRRIGPECARQIRLQFFFSSLLSHSKLRLPPSEPPVLLPIFTVAPLLLLLGFFSHLPGNYASDKSG